MMIIRIILAIRGRSHIGKCVFKNFAREGKVYGERFRRVTDGSKEFIWERVYPIFLKRVK